MSPTQESRTEILEKKAERGREVLENRVAKGEPGSKQPAHSNIVESNKEVAERVGSILESIGAEIKKSSAARSKEAGNVNKTPPEERTLADEVARRESGINVAAGHLAAARTALETEDVAAARLLSDPRYERDMRILELGSTGKLAHVPPAPEEVAAGIAREGLPPEVVSEIPKTPEEQVARDMQRLDVAEERADSISTAKAPEGDKGVARESATSSEANTPSDPGNKGSSLFGSVGNTSKSSDVESAKFERE